ncbi:MAG: hypothetical protein ACOYB0_08285 [Polynucleobacter sp.]
MKSTLTLIQAQQRYIDRTMNAKTGQRRRVRNAAGSELRAWLTKRGFSAAEVESIWRDAWDMVQLEIACEFVECDD